MHNCTVCVRFFKIHTQFHGGRVEARGNIVHTPSSWSNSIPDLDRNLLQQILRMCRKSLSDPTKDQV